MSDRIFETKIKPILKYVGSIGAAMASVAYIIIVLVMIKGFEAHKMLETTTFAIVNAIVGFIIMQFLKIQGVAFAKDLPENKAIMAQYNTNETKDKKYRSIKYYWFKTTIKDVFTKTTSIAATTIGLIYIVIQGSNDYNMLLMAITNLIMFLCWGLIYMADAYDFYNERHIPYVLDQLKQIGKGVEKNGRREDLQEHSGTSSEE